MAPTDQRVLKVNASQVGTVECCAGDDGVHHLGALEVGACRGNRRGADYASPDVASLHLQPSKHMGSQGPLTPTPTSQAWQTVQSHPVSSKVSNTTHTQSPHVDCALESPE